MSRRRKVTQLAYDRIVYWSARSVDFMLRNLPDPIALAVALSGVRTAEAVAPEWRRVAMRNFELTGVGPPEAILNGMRWSLARGALHQSRFGLYGRDNIRRVVDFEGADHYLRAKSGGRGVLLAGMHLGNWEIAGYAHHLLYGALSVLARRSPNERLNVWLNRRRACSGADLLPARGSWRRAISELRANRDVYLLDDLQPEVSRGVFTEFLGTDAFTSNVIPRVAAMTGSRVVPMLGIWSPERGKYVVRYYPPMTFRGDIDCETRALADWYAARIREVPDQWMWIHMRWQRRPAGDPAIYR